MMSILQQCGTFQHALVFPTFEKEMDQNFLTCTEQFLELRNFVERIEPR
jgi:hypothetical protein